MEGYLKKHATQSAYTTWAASNDFITPNVSLIEADGSLGYNPIVVATLADIMENAVLIVNGNNYTSSINNNNEVNTTSDISSLSISAVESGHTIIFIDGNDNSNTLTYDNGAYSITFNSGVNPDNAYITVDGSTWITFILNLA